MSKSKRTQRSTPASRQTNGTAKPANTGAAGAARRATPTSGGVATVVAPPSPAASTAAAMGAARGATRSTGSVAGAGRRMSATAGTRPQTGVKTSSVRPSGAANSSRAQVRAAYSKTRRRKAPTPWWQSPWAVIGGPIAAIVLVLVIFLVIASRGGASGTNAQPVPADVLQGVTTISNNTFATVGSGQVPNPLTATGGSSGFAKVPILLGSAGKPVFLYIGAEYCPYCAAERWAMVIALNRFGSFSNLHIISSSSSDVYPNTPTFTFYKSTYTSQYIDFQSVEAADRNEQPLQSMSATQSQLFSKYDSNGSYPFMDFGNQYIAIGASYQNTVLTDENWSTIAKQLNNPSSLVTQSIVGTANYMTAAICQITGNKPANVCSAAPIPAIEKTIGKPAGS